MSRVICDEPVYTYKKKFLKKQELRDFFADAMLQSYQNKDACMVELGRGETVQLATEVITEVAKYHKYDYTLVVDGKTLYITVINMHI